MTTSPICSNIAPVEGTADYSKWYLLIAAVAAFAALVSGAATIALARLTGRLTKATETYANLVREELDLLRAQLEAPLLFDVQLSYPTCYARCRHFGSSNSLPIQIKRVELQLEATERLGSPLAKDEHIFEDYLKPGKSWTKQVGQTVASKANLLPSPGFWAGLVGVAPKQQKAGILTARLEFLRAGESAEIVREYEVWTHWLSMPRLRLLSH